MLKYNNFLITGAASGLGKELAVGLNKLNKSLILLDKNNEGLESLKLKLDSKKNIKLINFDLSNLEKIKEMFNNDLAKENNIDCLINCAAYESDGFFEEVPFDEIINNSTVNAFAPLLLSRLLLPNLKKNSGAIVNVISTMSTVGVPGRISYCMSKASLRSISDVMRCELKHQKVHVLTVYPEVMDTPFWKSIKTFGRINKDGLSDPRKKNDPKVIAKDVIKCLEKNKFFYWRLSITNFFSIFHFIFTYLGDKIVENICDIKNSNINKK